MDYPANDRRSMVDCHGVFVWAALGLSASIFIFDSGSTADTSPLLVGSSGMLMDTSVSGDAPLPAMAVQGS